MNICERKLLVTRTIIGLTIEKELIELNDVIDSTIRILNFLEFFEKLVYFTRFEKEREKKRKRKKNIRIRREQIFIEFFLFFPPRLDGDPIKLPENLETLPRAEHFPTQRHRWNTNEVSLKTIIF